MTTTPANDAFERFARAHLPGKVERAIYPVVASTPDRDWAPGEIAAAAGVSNHEADQALRRFASAGIVDHRHVRGHGHRYRWHADMAYLRRSEEHTSELQSLMRISYAVLCLKTKNTER